MACAMEVLADKFETHVTLAPHDKQEENKEKGKMRHCAFCLISVPSEKVTYCTQCKRRAYCSKECQKADWTPKGKGQGHKVWCPLKCGEEDLDWEVGPVPGKGLGLIAKRPLPSKFRIMVDPCRSKDHPRVEDLMPQGGTTEQKFQLNCLGCDAADEEQAHLSVLCLRLSRANHNCDPNAGHLYDKKLKVKIVFAEREIDEGEEICISYQSFNDVSRDIPEHLWRSALKSKWGIVCPQDCFCRDAAIKKIVDQSKKLDSSILTLASMGNADMALEQVKLLMLYHDKIHSSWLDRKRTLYDGFQIAIMKRDTVELGKEYAKQLYEVASSIWSPEEEKLREYAEWMKNPQLHRNYLMSEKECILM